MIYLASPYSDRDPEVEELRYQAAYSHVRLAFSRKEIIFSPIVYCHQYYINRHTPGDFSFWQNFNEEMLLRATRLRVLRIAGWETSIGVTAEIAFASRSGITVEFTP